MTQNEGIILKSVPILQNHFNTEMEAQTSRNITMQTQGVKYAHFEISFSSTVSSLVLPVVLFIAKARCCFTVDVIDTVCWFGYLWPLVFRNLCMFHPNLEPSISFNEL